MSTKIFHSVCLLVVLISCQAFSQKGSREPGTTGIDTTWYEIVDVKKTDAAFELLYHITGSKEDEYEVTLALVRDGDPNFRITPKSTSGKIGVGSFAGKNNSIVWNYKKDLSKELKGNDYRFDLTVRRIEQGSFPWLWTGLGAAAAGGAAAVLLLGGGGSDAAPGQASVTTIPAIGISRPN